MKEGEHWVVPSQSGHGNYVVSFATKEQICTCPDFENRHVRCKHIIAVEISMTQTIDSQGNVTVTQTRRVTYSQNWTSYNMAQNEEVKAQITSSIYQIYQVLGRLLKRY